MKPGALHFRFVSQLVYKAVAISCVWILALVPDYPIAWSQQTQPAPTPPAPPQAAPTEAVPKIPPEQLDSLVAPIALYPDPLLGQTLVASTYPLELVQLWQWMQKNPTLKDQALADAVQKQNWDPSIQGLAAFPDVVQRMADNIAWTTDLGNAFLAQQSDVMDAVQRMRSKAQENGNLKTTPQQTVETQTVEGGKQVIVIEQSQPNVVYVPSYDPVVVYGAPAYPYPAYAYPGYVPGMMLSFGVGMAMGAAWGGAWGYGCGWGGGDVDINFENSFNRGDRERNANRGDRGQGGRGQGGQGGKWQHRPEHRGGAPYGDRKTADKFGGRTRGERPTGGQRPGGGLSASQRPAGGAGAGQRPGGGLSASQRPSGGASARQRPSGGSSDRVGNRSVSSGSKGSGFGSSNNTFGGGGYDGRSARSSSSRGSSSMGSGGFGGGNRGGYSGGSRGGGGRGGGGRGGGGRRR